MKDVVALIPQVIGELRSAWRYRWYGVAVAWTICILGWGVVAVLPDVYEASARVYVDTSSVLRPILTTQIIAPDMVAELTYVRQSLLGRDRLERVVRENALDPKAATPAQLNAVLSKLARTVQIETRPVSNQAGNVVATISYRHSDRDKAIGVVSSLLTALVEDTLGAAKQGSDTAGQFLDDRIGEYETRLQHAEQALADFKKQNADRLPGAEGGYFERIRTERTALDTAQKQVRLAESKAMQLRAQLASSSPVMPSGTQEAQLAPNSIDARIRDYRVQLDKLLLQYTDKHPDVIATRETLTKLEQQRADQLRALGVPAGSQDTLSLEANPVHQALQIALNQAEVDIATLREDAEERAAKLKVLQSLVNEVPQVEAELSRLNRDYDVIHQQYQALIRSRETQDLSEKAAVADHVGFKVIDPPLASLEPVAPLRPIYLSLVFIAALGAAGSLCWILAALRPVFAHPRALRDAVGLPVIGVVDQIVQARAQNDRAFKLLTFSGAMGGLAVLFALTIVLELRGHGLHTLVNLI